VNGLHWVDSITAAVGRLPHGSDLSSATEEQILSVGSVKLGHIIAEFAFMNEAVTKWALKMNAVIYAFTQLYIDDHYCYVPV
jgi:hypothetical protein